jgi:protein-tyrosine phosphatase
VKEDSLSEPTESNVDAATTPGPSPIAASIPNSHVVPDTRLIAGEYPGSEFEADARTKLAVLLDAGVTLFVDLTHTHELVPYEPVLARLAVERGVTATYRRMPIRDMDVCEAPHMHAVLDTIDSALDAGRTVYIHCWGGVGRTDTVVGAFLVRHGADGDAALAEVNRLFQTMTPAKLRRHPGGSPQTSAQRRLVQRWASADRA